MTLQDERRGAGAGTPDALLLRSAGRGDEESFLKLYQRHKGAVFGFAYRLTLSVEAAEDITQECFLSLAHRPDRFDPSVASLKTYLLAAARNLALKRFEKTGAEVDLESVKTEPVSNAVDPLGAMLEGETAEVVRRAMERLSPLQREALVLFEFEELSLSEIAQVVRADVGTVKTRLYRARQQLKRLLLPYYSEGRDMAADEVLK